MSKAKAIARAKNATRILTGDKELDRKLARIKKTGTANKLARRGLTKALRLCVKAIKAQVPSQYKDAKRAIGSVFDKKGKGHTVRAKAGAGVGIKAEKVEKHKRDAGRKLGRGAGGRFTSIARKGSSVGLSTANIHWFILGTADRTQKTGKRVGRMPPVMPDIVKKGFSSASAQMMSTIRTEILAGLDKEAAKK